MVAINFRSREIFKYAFRDYKGVSVFFQYQSAKSTKPCKDDIFVLREYVRPKRWLVGKRSPRVDILE